MSELKTATFSEVLPSAVTGALPPLSRFSCRGESANGQMGRGGEGGGRKKNRRKDRKEGKREETGRRVEAGCRTDSGEQTDSEREKRKQRSILSDLGSYPRGPAIGPARGESGEEEEEESEGAAVLYIYVSLHSGQKKMYVSASECVFQQQQTSAWTHKSVNKAAAASRRAGAQGGGVGVEPRLVPSAEGNLQLQG